MAQHNRDHHYCQRRVMHTAAAKGGSGDGSRRFIAVLHRWKLLARKQIGGGRVVEV